MKYCWRWISSGVGCSDTRAGVRGCSPVLCQWYFIGPLGGTFKKVRKRKEEKTEKANGLAENPANLVGR